VDFAALGREYLVIARALYRRGPLNENAAQLSYCWIDPARAAERQDRGHLTVIPCRGLRPFYKTLFKDGDPFSPTILDEIAITTSPTANHGPLRAVMPVPSMRSIMKILSPTRSRRRASCSISAAATGEDACAEFHRNPFFSATTTARRIAGLCGSDYDSCGG